MKYEWMKVRTWIKWKKLEENIHSKKIKKKYKEKNEKVTLNRYKPPSVNREDEE